MLPEATREGNKIHGLLGVLNLTLLICLSFIGSFQQTLIKSEGQALCGAGEATGRKQWFQVTRRLRSLDEQDLTTVLMSCSWESSLSVPGSSGPNPGCLPSFLPDPVASLSRSLGFQLLLNWSSWLPTPSLRQIFVLPGSLLGSDIHELVLTSSLPWPPVELSQNLPAVSPSFHCPDSPSSVHLLHEFLNAVLASTCHASFGIWLLHVALNRDGTMTHSKCSHYKLFPNPNCSAYQWTIPPASSSGTQQHLLLLCALLNLFSSQLFSPFLSTLPSKVPFCYDSDLNSLFLSLLWPLQSLSFWVFFFFFFTTNQLSELVCSSDG